MALPAAGWTTQPLSGDHAGFGPQEVYGLDFEEWDGNDRINPLPELPACDFLIFHPAAKLAPGYADDSGAQ